MKSLIYHGPGIRIDKRLTEQLPYSRSFFSHLFERGAIRISLTPNSSPKGRGDKTGKVVKKSYKLKDGDEVIIENLERFVDGGILDECPAWEIDVRLEKDDYMVIYKPKGVLSHPNSVRDVQHPSVVGGIYHYINSDSNNVGENKSIAIPTSGSFIRAGLIHRLDKETDGLMIIAKTEKGLAYFKDLFQQKSLCETIVKKEEVPLKKYYTAVSEVTPVGADFLQMITGKLPYIIQEDVVPKVPHPVVKEGITRVLAIMPYETPLSPSSTSPLNRGECQFDIGERIRVELEILTGRTHQIRYHLSKYGLPIVGDYVYGEEDEAGMQLTAKKLEFVDVYGEQISLNLDI